MWFFLGSIELSSNVKPVWVGLKIKGAEITQFSTPLLNCHTCPKKHIQRFENTLFLPPPMAIVDRLKKKHIPPPKHTHTQRKKTKTKNNNPSPRKWWPFSSTWRFAVWTSPENRRRFGIVVLLQMSRGDFFRGKSLYFLKCFVEF